MDKDPPPNKVLPRPLTAPDMLYLVAQPVPEMRETQFVRQNQEKWRAFEALLDRPNPDPRELSELFIQITDDLAYARTFYPNRSVRVYLNTLAQRAFNVLHRGKRQRRSRFVRFWTHELPQLVYESRRAFRLAFVLFMGAVIIGAFSSAAVPEFLESILGANYVEMTRENIDSGDPMAVYKQRGELDMTLGITMNNILVALRTFVLGALYMVGSFFILLFNGIMLGSFMYFFFENGLLQESFLTVFMHGTLEISAIVIAGAAGITMGRGLVFPGTLTRLRAFQRSARRGVKIMAGTVPLFILAGIIEGFITRHTEVPDLIRGFFILLCLAFVVGYFIWWPVRLARRGFDAASEEERLSPDRPVRIDRHEVKTSGQLFIETFQLFGLHAGRLAGLSALCALLSTGAFFALSNDAPAQSIGFELVSFGSYLRNLADFFVRLDPIYSGVAQLLILTGLLFFAARITGPYLFGEAEINKAQRVTSITYCLLAATLLLGVLYIDTGLVLLVLPFAAVLPLLLVWSSRLPKTDTANAFGRAWSYSFTQFSAWLMLAFSLLVLSTGAFLLFDTSLFWSLVQALLTNFALEATTMQHLGTIILGWLVAFVFYGLCTVWLCGAAVYYLSARELRHADGLTAAIANVGTQRSIKGLLRE